MNILESKWDLVKYCGKTIQSFTIDEDRLAIKFTDGSVLDIWANPKNRWNVYDTHEDEMFSGLKKDFVHG